MGAHWLTVLSLIYRVTVITITDTLAIDLMGQRRVIQNNKIENLSHAHGSSANR